LILSPGESCEKERARLPHKIHPFIPVVVYFLCICIVFNSVAETLVTWFVILCFLALHVLIARVDDESMC
jgi:energy-coupling factor transporter transmembrane protein EcfT